MKHFLVLILFAALVGVVFGGVSRGAGRQKLLYGLKVFGEFVGVGIILAWILYWVPA